VNWPARRKEWTPPTHRGNRRWGKTKEEPNRSQGSSFTGGFTRTTEIKRKKDNTKRKLSNLSIPGTGETNCDWPTLGREKK